MSNTDQPADLESIFKFECIPHSAYELFKTVVTVGICTGVEALTLFQYHLIPSLIFKRQEEDKYIAKRVFKDRYGNIYAVNDGDHSGPRENGYELLQQYLYENCFTYSFYAPDTSKVNSAVLIPTEQTNCWALATGTWERNLDTGTPATYTMEKNEAPISQDFLQAVIEIIKEAAVKATYDTVQLAHSQEKKEEEEEKSSEPPLTLAPLGYPLTFKKAMTEICKNQGLVMVSQETGFAYGFDPCSQLYSINTDGIVYGPNEMGIDEIEIASNWEVLSYNSFMLYACSGRIRASQDNA